MLETWRVPMPPSTWHTWDRNLPLVQHPRPCVRRHFVPRQTSSFLTCGVRRAILPAASSGTTTTLNRIATTFCSFFFPMELKTNCEQSRKYPNCAVQKSGAHPSAPSRACTPPTNLQKTRAQDTKSNRDHYPRQANEAKWNMVCGASRTLLPSFQ